MKRKKGLGEGEEKRACPEEERWEEGGLSGIGEGGGEEERKEGERRGGGGSFSHDLLSWLEPGLKSIHGNVY